MERPIFFIGTRHTPAADPGGNPVAAKLQGLDNLTGNEFAERLLHSKLYSLFPAIPKYDEMGELLNADRYKGERKGK